MKTTVSCVHCGTSGKKPLARIVPKGEKEQYVCYPDCEQPYRDINSYYAKIDKLFADTFILDEGLEKL